MSWLSRILRIGKTAVDAGALDIIKAAAASAKNVHEFRTAISTAAQKGDLDPYFRKIDAARKRGDDYIANG